jgi:hypothetical protein
MTASLQSTEFTIKADSKEIAEIEKRFLAAFPEMVKTTTVTSRGRDFEMTTIIFNKKA